MDVTFSSNKQDENVKHNLILENNEKQNLKRVSQKKRKRKNEHDITKVC